MTVNEVKQALGSWSVRLKENTPQSILDRLEYFGHIAIHPGRVNPAEYGDLMLANSRYVGVHLGMEKGSDGNFTLRGKGMAFWLGDDTKSDAYEIGITFTAIAFSTVINTLLPQHGAVTAGAISALAGTYSGTHKYESPRSAIDYVTQTYGAEWRVNGNGTLDAGLVGDLYRTTPQAILQRKQTGDDIRFRALRGGMGVDTDVEDYTTRVLLLAEGDGASIATGSATAGVVPYKDIHGNTVWLTRLVSESDTSAVNANTRAAIMLDQFDSSRSNVRLSTDEFDIKGDVVVGDTIYVFDPLTGLEDVGNEEYWEGVPIHPVKLRCVEMTWPIRTGWTVGFRDNDGVWTDLSPFMIWEGGSTEIVVGQLGNSIVNVSSEPIGDRPNADTSIPVAPVFTTTSLGAYQSDLTNTTKAAIYLAWGVPLNADGSVILDGDHYEIRFRASVNIDFKIRWGLLAPYRWGALSASRWGAPLTAPVGSTPEWQTAFVGWGTNAYTLLELTSGLPYEIQIRAVDTTPHFGPWSSSLFVTTIGDIFPPAQPAAPVVAGSRLSIQVVHTLGKNTGGTYNLDPDMDHLDVHVGGSASFYPDAGNRVGRLLAGQAMLQAGIPAVGTFTIEPTETVFVKVVAVDRAGNRSDASPAATVTALLVDDAHIGTLTVSKITAGTITADWILAAAIKTGLSGNRAELKSTGLSLYNALNQETIRLDTATANIRVLNGRLEVVDAIGNTILEIGKTSDGRYGLRVNDSLGAAQVRAGELASGGYGMEAVNNAGDLVSLSTLAFGMTATKDSGFGTCNLTEWGDLTGASVGPAVTVTVGTSGRVVIFLSCSMTIGGAVPGTIRSFVGFETTDVLGNVWPGAGTSTSRCLELGHTPAAGTPVSRLSATRAILINNLKAGTYTFTMKYQTIDGIDGNFSNREILALPY